MSIQQSPGTSGLSPTTNLNAPSTGGYINGQPATPGASGPAPSDSGTSSTPSYGSFWNPFGDIIDGIETWVTQIVANSLESIAAVALIVFGIFIFVTGQDSESLGDSIVSELSKASKGESEPAQPPSSGGLGDILKQAGQTAVSGKIAGNLASDKVNDTLKDFQDSNYTPTDATIDPLDFNDRNIINATGAGQTRGKVSDPGGDWDNDPMGQASRLWGSVSEQAAGRTSNDVGMNAFDKIFDSSAMVDQEPDMDFLNSLAKSDPDRLRLLLNQQYKGALYGHINSGAPRSQFGTHSDYEEGIRKAMADRLNFYNSVPVSKKLHNSTAMLNLKSVVNSPDFATKSGIDSVIEWLAL